MAQPTHLEYARTLPWATFVISWYDILFVPTALCLNQLLYVPFLVAGQRERRAFQSVLAEACSPYPGSWVMLQVPHVEKRASQEPWLREHGSQGWKPGEQTWRDLRTLANKAQREANSFARNWGGKAG